MSKQIGKWFEWKKHDLRELGIKDFELADFLRAGLQPYKRKTLSHQPIPCPEHFHLYSDECLFFNRLKEFKNYIKNNRSFQYSGCLGFQYHLRRGYGKTGNLSNGFYEYYSSVFDRLYLLKCQQIAERNPKPNKGKEQIQEWKEGISKQAWDMLRTTPTTLRDIMTIEKDTSQELSALGNEMGCDPTTDEALFSWKFIPSFPDDPKLEDQVYENLKVYLLENEKATFKKDEALEIKKGFEPKSVDEAENIVQETSSPSVVPDEGYAFIKVGKTGSEYDFIFKGERIRLNTYGADYMYYLMRYYKYPENIDVVDLATNLGKHSDKKSNEDRDEKIDKKGIQQITKKIESLEDELLEAETNNDFEKAHYKKEELKKLKDQFKRDTFQGKGKTFSSNKDKVLGRIRKAMERTLDEIHKENEEAYEHLHTAFFPLNSNPKSYKPTKNIPWKFS